jgi:hypothetical protein
MAGTGETAQKVWVLYQHVSEEGQDMCEVLKVFGNAEAALAAYLEITVDEEDGQEDVRANIERGESVLFTTVDGGDCILERVPFVGPMSGGRRRRKTTRRNK